MLDIQSLMTLIGGVGQSAAVITAMWLMLKFQAEQRVAQEKRDEWMFTQLADIAKDRGQVIKDNTVSIQKMQTSVDRLIDVAERTVSTQHHA